MTTTTTTTTTDTTEAPEATPTPPPDAAELEEFSGHVAQYATAAINAVLVHLGDRLGLWKALAESGPADAATLAARAGVAERYLQEWLSAQAANGFATYDASTGEFSISPAQAAVLADEDSAHLFQGAFQMLPSMWKMLPAHEAAFRSGDGIAWGDWDGDFFDAQERFSRPLHTGLLVDVYLAAVPGLMATLEAGALVADVGCGYGTSTITLAQRFPASRFVGYDFHERSIGRAREAARRAGVEDRVRFETAASSTFPGEGYDLVLFCDSLHDLGDPVAAARRAALALAPGGMLVTLDPRAAGDSLAENLGDPLAGAFYAVSTLLCTPGALAQGAEAHGTLAGERALTEVLREAGFAHVVRVAPEAPMNMVLVASDGELA